MYLCCKNFEGFFVMLLQEIANYLKKTMAAQFMDEEALKW